MNFRKHHACKGVGVYIKISIEIQKIENESEQDIQELFDKNEEYAGLHLQLDIIREEIDMMMVETKFRPLCGMTIDEIKIFDIYFKEKVRYPHIEAKAGPDRTITIKKYPDPKVIGDGIIEKYLDLEFIKEEDRMKERVDDIPELILNFHIDPKTLYFYRQLLKCYVYGAFEASCVLCRAIAETLAKKFIEYKGYGDLLVGRDKKAKTMSVQEICINELGIDKEIIALYTKICNKADNILHKKDIVSEEDTIEIIKLLQEFMKKFPKQM